MAYHKACHVCVDTIAANISDHTPIFASLLPAIKEKKNTKTRDNVYNYSYILTFLQNSFLMAVYDGPTSDTKLRKFTQIILEVPRVLTPTETFYCPSIKDIPC